MNARRLATGTMPHRSFLAADWHPLLQALFALEGRRELMEFREGRIPYWGLIRLPLVIRLVDRIRGELDSGDIFLRPRRTNPVRAFLYALTSAHGSPFRHADKDFVFFCSGVNWVSRGSTFFNCRVDYFLENLPAERTLLVEGADGLRYRRPRAVRPVACKGGLTSAGAAWARIGWLGRRETRRLADFMLLMKETIGDGLTGADYDLLEDHLRRALLRSRVYNAVCDRLLDRLKPRMLFVESAHFGLDIELTAAARERGICTVEYQHGAVNPLCPYHNFNPALLAAGYDQCLPSYFLSYGDFWKSYLTTSAQIVPIGNPHLEAGLAKPRLTPPRQNSVYFLSSAGPARPYVERLRELVAEGFDVTFRPHPVERPLLRARYGTVFQELSIAVDLSDDFYSRLREHAIVVGDGQSTSIFEALALAGPNVFVMPMIPRLSEDLPTHSFLPTVSSARELRSRLAEEPQRLVALEDLFATNWRERFSRFVATALAE